MKCLDHEVIVSLFQFMQTRCKSVNVCLVGCVQLSFEVCGINFLSEISFHHLNSHLLTVMERFHCFDYYSSPILEGCVCFALHINGYTNSLLGAPTVILNKVTCGYISNE